MKTSGKLVFLLLSYILLIICLLQNPRIGFFSLTCIFLVLPLIVHFINVSIRRKLKRKDNWLGQEAERQLKLFEGKSYRIFMTGVTILTACMLSLLYFGIITEFGKQISTINVYFFLSMLLLGITTLQTIFLIRK